MRLENFETIVDIMMSIVFRERGVEYFEVSLFKMNETISFEKILKIVILNIMLGI